MDEKETDYRTDLKRLFFHLKPVAMITCLKDGSEWSISQLAKESGATYVYTHGIIKRLVQAGFVHTRLEGKRRMVKLTEEGSVIAQLLEEALRKIDDIYDQQATASEPEE
ncbi:helix-turn-helix transcriptional regulator [Candidatus Micrarchaeota archaeon]|nr:helix-turn-helix transcriptional regulator [Candidatus Micrarchaeota archaeon]